jgi:hypothetical protein
MAKRLKQAANRRPTNFDKIAKAAMSREMLAAGLTAAAAAIAASPKARARSATPAWTPPTAPARRRRNMVNSASKLGSLIAEAVADAAQRVLSGKWTDEDSRAFERLDGSSKPAHRRRPRARPAQRARRQGPSGQAGQDRRRKPRPAQGRDTATKRRSSAAARKRPTKPATPAS